MLTKKKSATKALLAAASCTLILFSLAACGNSHSQAASSPKASQSSAASASPDAMSEVFKKGGIWFLSSAPSPSAHISQAFYFEGGKVTVFQYLSGSGVDFADLSGNAAQKASELYQWDSKGWSAMFPQTPYKKPEPTSYSLELLTNEDGKSGAVEILEDKSVVDPVDGEASLVSAGQNEGAVPQGDFLYLPLTTLPLVNAASGMGKVAPLTGRYRGYLNWNALVENVAQDVMLSSPSIDLGKEWMTTLSSSDFSLDGPKTSGVEVHGQLSISQSLAKNDRMA